MAQATVVVLGCGMGGIAAANELRSLLPAPNRVIVIDKDAFGSFPPSYLWLVTGGRRLVSMRRDRSRLARKGIEFVCADIRQIDLETRQVRADSREVRFDYLVIALGAELAPEVIPGLGETAHTFYTLEGSERLAANLRYFAGGRIVIAIAEPAFKGPAAPYEAAMLLEHLFHERRMRQKVEISVYTPEALPLAAYGPACGEEVAGLLAHRGIAFVPGRRLSAVDAGRREAVFDDDSRAPFDLLLSVPVHRPPEVVRETGLADEGGWLPVDRATLETERPGVFAIGDIARLALPGGASLPRAGTFAEGQARAVARVIAQRVKDDGQGRLFVEVGAGAASMLTGSLLKPDQRIEMTQPSIVWHWARAAQERYWLWRHY
jgi:sulfide:quinone oxidoreductase